MENNRHNKNKKLKPSTHRKTTTAQQKHENIKNKQTKRKTNTSTQNEEETKHNNITHSPPL